MTLNLSDGPQIGESTQFQLPGFFPKEIEKGHMIESQGFKVYML